MTCAHHQPDGLGRVTHGPALETQDCSFTKLSFSSKLSWSSTFLIIGQLYYWIIPLKADAGDAQKLMLSEDSSEHFLTPVREGRKAPATLLSKCGLTPITGVDDEVPEEKPVGAINFCNVFTRLQDKFLRGPTWGSIFLTPRGAKLHLDTGRKGEL